MSDFKETLRLLSKNCRENDTLTKFACFTEEADAIDAALEYIAALESASKDAIRREALEEAAKLCDRNSERLLGGVTTAACSALQVTAAAIRALSQKVGDQQ